MAEASETTQLLEEASLEGILAECWGRLERAVADPQHPLHWPVMASCALGGGADARVVVLRGVYPAERAIEFYTDIRSRKIADLRVDSGAAVLFFDPRDRLQIRVTGGATIHSRDALADERWAACSLGTRKTFLAERMPGATTLRPNSNLPEYALYRDISAEESERGRRNFAVVRVNASKFDWYVIGNTEHRRAWFEWDPDGQLQASWRMP